ncbi:MAG: DUF971 domain-containing protein [Bdellovibrionales bacterium]|nr:DUF971 domain-containing protein [Bdellovibrionales bacterium]
MSKNQNTTDYNHRIPTDIQPSGPKEVFFKWNTGESFRVPYFEIRFECPCASCVDEHTGKRVLKRESISPEIRATGMQVIGRYAIQISWTDGHATGMYHFDRLYELCRNHGTSA